MKQLAVLVEKSKLGDIPKFQNFLTSILYDESSCRGHLGVHSSSLIFFKLIRLIYLYMWLSNTFISCLFSILWFSRRFTRSLRIFRTLLFQPPSNLVCLLPQALFMYMCSLFQPRSQASQAPSFQKFQWAKDLVKTRTEQNRTDWTGLHH